MTPRPLLAVLGVVVLGLHAVKAEVPLDDPVAVIRSGRSFGWVGTEGDSVFVRPSQLDQLWRIDYTPEGPVGLPVPFTIPAGFTVWHAAGDQALLAKGSMQQDSFRVIRLSDGTTLGELKDYGRLILNAPQSTPRGLVATGITGNGDQYGYRLLTYDAASSVPVLKTYFTHPMGSGDSLIGATDEWFALLGTEPTIGNKIITILRTADLGEIRRLTIPWQSGASSVGAASGNLLYFKLRDRFQCLDVASGSLSDVLFIDPATYGNQNHQVAADASGFWFYRGTEPELQLHTGSPAAGFQLAFRGRIQGDYFSYSARIHPTGGRCHVFSTNEVQVFDPARSRPSLTRLDFPPVREMDATYPVVISLDRAPEREVSVRFRTSGGSASPGLDYDPVDQVLTFPAGTRSITVPLRLKADLIAESNETIAFEASSPDGIRLADGDLGGLTLVASGMDHRRIQLNGPDGNPVPWGGVQVVLKDVMLGTVAGDLRGHLWDRHTAAFIAVTDLPSATSAILETPAGLEAVVRGYQTIEIFRIDPANGRTLARRAFHVPSWLDSVVPIGGGRVFVSYHEGSSATLFGRIYALDGPAEGRDFPLFGGVFPGSFDATSDGRHLVIGWSATMNWYSPPPGPPQRLRWYATDTLEVVHEMAVDFQPSPVAIRGDLLLCQGGHAVDLVKRVVAWKRPAIGYYSAIGDTHLISPSGVWEIATGLKVADGYQLDSRLPGDAPFDAHHPVDGTGGMIIGGHDYRADRQRPGLEWLGVKLRPDEEQARMPLRTCEPSDQTLTAGFTRLDAVHPSDRRQLSFPNPSATVPGDGKIHLHDFHAPPEINASATFPTTHGVEVRITAPGATPLVRTLSLRRENSTAPLPPHLARKLPAVSAIHPPRFQMRYADGRIVLATGTDYPDVDPDGRVHILDAKTGALLFSMSDPAPLYRRAFAMDATVQGNKLLVLVRHVPTGTRTAEIYEIPTGRLLGTVADPASGKTFPSFLDCSETHFALGAASLAWWDQKSTAAVYQWSDLKRVFQKSGRAGGGLGNGVDLKGNRFFAGIYGSKPGDFGLVAQPVGAKFKMPKLAKGFGGRLIPGEPLLYLMDRDGITRAYDPTNYREIWSVYGDLTGAVEGTERDFVFIDATRDLSLRDGESGVPLATSRLPGDRSRILSTRAVASPDLIFYGMGKELYSVKPSDLGDFADTRRWQNRPTVLSDPDEDLDGSGQPDFAEYVRHRLPPGGSLGHVRIEGGQVVVEEGDPPPVDLVSLAEAEVVPGWWYPVAWRDGLSPWEKRPLPSGVSDATPLRVRHLPHPVLGWFPALLSWPPQAVAIAGDSTNVLPDRSRPLASRAPSSTVGTAGDGMDSQPLRLLSGKDGWALEYVRPLGEAAPAILETSTDLQTWSPVSGDPLFVTTVEPAEPGTEKVILRVAASDTRRFFRLRR